MDTLLFLLVDGVTNGAVYALVALSLIVVYTVTRVVNIAQGEYVTLGALSFASALSGSFNSLSALVAGGLALFAFRDIADRRLKAGARSRILLTRAVWVICVLATGVAANLYPGSYWFAVMASLVATASLGTLVYRLTVDPVPNASPIVLLIVSVGVYMIIHGATVMIWGAEARSVPPIVTGGLALGPIYVTYQSLWISVFAIVAMIVNTILGLDRVSKVVLQSAVMLRLDWFRQLILVRLPAAGPHLVTGLKLAVTYSVIGIVAGEFILATSGIGKRVAFAYDNFDNNTMYGMLLLLLLGVIAVNGLLSTWERRLHRRFGQQ